MDVNRDLLKDTDVHIHFPAGAISKDGPSAGVAIAAVLVSLFASRCIRSDTAMTGEVTLRGLVLPVTTFSCFTHFMLISTNVSTHTQFPCELRLAGWPINTEVWVVLEHFYAWMSILKLSRVTVTTLFLSLVDSSLSLSITFSLFCCWLKTYLFYESFQL